MEHVMLNSDQHSSLRGHQPGMTAKLAAQVAFVQLHCFHRPTCTGIVIYSVSADKYHNYDWILLWWLP